jgi:hypothetical protein
MDGDIFGFVGKGERARRDDKRDFLDFFFALRWPTAAVLVDHNEKVDFTLFGRREHLRSGAIILKQIGR